LKEKLAGTKELKNLYGRLYEGLGVFESLEGWLMTRPSPPFEKEVPDRAEVLLSSFRKGGARRAEVFSPYKKVLLPYN